MNIQLARLIDAYLDAPLTDADASALREAIAADPASARAFARAVYIDHCLAERLAANEQASPAKPNPISKIENRKSKIAFPLALAAALLLAACGVAIVALSLNNSQSEIRNPQSLSPSPIATLIESSGTVLIDDGIANEGDEYPAGVYSIASGSAEFQLASGASVTMRGRTRMALRGDRLATIDYGQAVFVCPPSAHGYTVNLPRGAKVVDLGTEFVITVAPDGDAAVRVSEGRVTFTAPHSGTTRTLEVGDLIRSVGDRVILNESDLAHAMPARVVNIDFGPAKTDAGAGVAAPSGAFWNRLIVRHARGLRAADGATTTPVTVTTSNKHWGQRPGQPVGVFDDYAFNHAEQGPWTIHLDGLDDSQTYDLVVYSATAIDQGAGFAVGGVEQSTLGNRTDAMIDGISYVRFTALSPTNGRIEVRVSTPAPLDRSGYFCNGLQLVASRGFTATGPDAPEPQPPAP